MSKNDSLGKRLKTFIESHYETQRNFAKVTDIPFQLLNKYVQDKSLPNSDMLMKFQSQGLSIDWLLTGMGTMYAPNSQGIQLIMEKITKENPHQELSRLRLHMWILENFETLQKFTIAAELTLNEVHHILTHNYIPSISLMNTLKEIGCNTNWLMTGEGSQYENNATGKLLKFRKESISRRLVENNKNEDSGNQQNIPRDSEKKNEFQTNLDNIYNDEDVKKN